MSKLSSKARLNEAEIQLTLPEALIYKVPCRIKESERLYRLFGKPHHFTVESIFLYGHSDTGKTYVLRTLLDELKLFHLWVNCVVMYNPRLLFESILNQLSKPSLSPGNNFTGTANCENMCDFVNQLKKILKNREDVDGSTLYIVLDKAEKLCEMPPTVLSALLRLQELTQLNLCVVLVSDCSWDKFHIGSYLCEPYLLHFPQYSKDEVLEIISKDCPTGYTADFFSEFLNLVINVCYIVTRNLQELRYLALSNFEKYCEPLLKDEATKKDRQKLWKNIQPHLKNALNSIYLRESSVPTSDVLPDSTSQVTIDATHRANFELPFLSKFLLLASYIASYNPIKEDVRMFVKNPGRMRKKIGRKNMKRITPQHECGPKTFPLSRMLSIFYSITEEEGKPSTHLLSQVSTLVSLRLLLCTTNDLDDPKYKCVVSLDFIQSISKTVQFDIMRYLVDFT